MTTINAAIDYTFFMEYFGKKLLIQNRHLYWENGEPFFLLADTQWYGLTNRCSPDDFKKILQDRKQKGFTAIQLVIGTPPETTIFDENAKSTNGEFIFNKDFSINSKYFDDIDEKIRLVIEHKLVPILYGSWGHYIDQTGPEPMKQMWSEIVRRYSDLPVIYSLCGEADLQLPSTQISLLKRVLNKLPHIKRMAKKAGSFIQTSANPSRLEKWQQVGNHLKQINTKGHPITVHLQSAKLSSEVFTDPSFISLEGFQSGHSMEGFATMKRLFEKTKEERKTVINLEPLYEGILDQFDTRLQNYAFYTSVFSGACGHGYGAHGLWQMAAGDNFMKHWGNSSWKKALGYPGGKAIGAAKTFFTSNNIQWTDISLETSLKVFSDKAPLLPLVGRVSSHIFIYIPYPEKMKSIEIPGVESVEIYDACTFNKLKDSSELDINFIRKSNLELFIRINIV